MTTFNINRCGIKIVDG